MKSVHRVIFAVTLGAILGVAAYRMAQPKAPEAAIKVVPATELQAPPDSPPQPPVKNLLPEPKEPEPGRMQAPGIEETPWKDPVRKDPFRKKPIRKERVRKEPVQEPPASLPPPAPVAPVEMGTLSLNSSPWSHVTINGMPVGTTPLTLKLPVGTYDVVLSCVVLPERKHEMQVQIQGGETVKRKHYFKDQ